MMIMFTKISWATYIITMGSALIVYYGFVILKYYSFDLQKLFRQKTNQKPSDVKEYSQETLPANITPIEESADETMERVEQFIVSLKSLISQSIQIRESKNEFLESLKPLL